MESMHKQELDNILMQTPLKILILLKKKQKAIYPI